jgi:uncharacterized protein (TIGR02444 family)
VTREALWHFALDVYGRPGLEPLLLELQDVHGQCVPFLLWSLWMAASGRAISPAKAAACAELARAWQDTAVEPLRTLRRDLKVNRKAGVRRAGEQLRIRVKTLELDAERMLLQMLEKASPAPGDVAIESLCALQLAVVAWGASAPSAMLEEVVRLAS